MREEQEKLLAKLKEINLRVKASPPAAIPAEILTLKQEIQPVMERARKSANDPSVDPATKALDAVLVFIYDTVILPVMDRIIGKGH